METKPQSFFQLHHECLDSKVREFQKLNIVPPDIGAVIDFWGRVRNHNNGTSGVVSLEYEAYTPLALKEGNFIINEAFEKFNFNYAFCIHRIGKLKVGELAIWIRVLSHHRHMAFGGGEYIIDEIKKRVPIWKKETYQNQDSDWVTCHHHL